MKNRKWIGLGVLIVICIALIPVIQDWMIPDALRESRNEEAEALRFKSNESTAVVFYPKDIETEFAETMARSIKEELNLSRYEAKQLKVDFKKSEQGGYLFLCFDAVDENEQILKLYTGICNLETHESVTVADLVQETFYDYVSSELRYQIKESNVLGDFAYTTAFYEMTSSENLHDLKFYLDESKGYVYVELQIDDSQELFCVELDAKQVYPYLKEDHVLYDSSQWIEPFRHYVDPDRPMVALTFDDGPVRKNTLKALESLNAYDAKGTFFMLGYRMENNPDVVLKVIGDGHEIGSHTYNHPYLTKKGTNLAYQMNRNQEILSELTNSHAEVKLLRPPYGSMNQAVKDAATTPLILWSLDTLDWKSLDAQKVHQAIMDQVQDGDIILLHDLHESSVESLDTVVPALIDAGYQLVTVSELMEARGIEMVNGVSYSKARKKLSE